MTATPETDAPTAGRTLTPRNGLYDLFSLTGWRARRVLRAFPVAAGTRVLEIGCGTGGLAVELARAAGPKGRTCAIDPSAPMIAETRRKAARAGVTVDARIAPVERLPFEDGSFDLVFGTLMLHHLPAQTLADGMREVLRVLVPGGLLRVADFRPAMNALHGHPGWLPAIGAAGFAEVRQVGTILRLIGLVEARKP